MAPGGMVTHCAASTRMSPRATLSTTHPVPPRGTPSGGWSGLLYTITWPSRESPQNLVGLGRLTESSPSLMNRIVSPSRSPDSVCTLVAASSSRTWSTLEGDNGIICASSVQQKANSNSTTTGRGKSITKCLMCVRIGLSHQQCSVSHGVMPNVSVVVCVSLRQQDKSYVIQKRHADAELRMGWRYHAPFFGTGRSS